MPLPPETNLAAARRDYYARLRDQALAPLWEVLSALVPPSPRTSAVAARWRYDTIRPFIAEAAS
jgi:gentisate 1,2-dioxygenase